MIIPVWYIRFLTMFFLPALSSSQINEFTLKGVLIERITRFIEWPNDDFKTKMTFTIVVIGENHFGKKLENIYSNHLIKNKPVSIKYVNGLYEINECDLLFISGSEKEHLVRILESIKVKPVLIMGDTEGYAEKGIHINLYLEENSVHFEINENCLKKSGLKVNHLLYTMARIVNSER